MHWILIGIAIGIGLTLAPLALDLLILAAMVGAVVIVAAIIVAIVISYPAMALGVLFTSYFAFLLASDAIESWRNQRETRRQRAHDRYQQTRAGVIGLLAVSSIFGFDEIPPGADGETRRE